MARTTYNSVRLLTPVRRSRPPRATFVDGSRRLRRALGERHPDIMDGLRGL